MAVFDKRTTLPDVRFGRASGSVVGFEGARNRNGASTPPVYKKKKNLRCRTLLSALSLKPRPHGHDLCRGVLFLRRNPVSISIDELYFRRRGQKSPIGCVLARAPTALPGGRARLIARVWSRACVTEPAPTGLPPSRADGSPENFSPAAFDVAHMYVCIASSVIRLWYSSRKLWGKSFQESRRRAQAGHAARAPSHSEKSELGIYSRRTL